MRHETANEAGEHTWLRLKLPAKAHKALKDRGKLEGRGVVDFVTALLLDAAAGNFGIGEPSTSTAPNDDDVYSIRKPSELPLSAYARNAQHLILLGTTLRSVRQFMECFLEPKAAAGARLTFLLVHEELFASNPALLNQVALRHGREPSEVQGQLHKTLDQLETLEAAHPTNVSIVKLRFLPTFGLTIADPFTASAKMRVSFYLFRHPSECNLALHIQPSTSESQTVFRYFMAHYERVLVDARDWPDTQDRGIAVAAT